LCPACKRPIPTNELDIDTYVKFGFTREDLEAHTIYEAAGCDKCSGGYKGRAAIHEALFFTKEIRRLIMAAGEDVNEELIRTQAVKDGMWTLRRSGIERVKEGTTTLEEVAAATTED
jgi:type IV pilus assembly protein PilB